MTTTKKISLGKWKQIGEQIQLWKQASLQLSEIKDSPLYAWNKKWSEDKRLRNLKNDG